MAEVTTIFQHWIFSKFILPFLLIVTLVYAVLEKTKLLGDAKHQLNAIVAFVVGLTFTGVAYYTDIVNNMILFLSVALVVLFVILLIWGFIWGEKEAGKGFVLEGWMKWVLGILAGVTFLFAVFWATGLNQKILDSLFGQRWSNTFWTNFLFIAVIVVAIVLLLKNQSKGGK
jgi:hypothetical protein